MRACLRNCTRVKRSGFVFAALVVLAIFGSAKPASAQSINLAWDANTESNLAGYRVYVGTVSGSYSQSFDVPASQTTYSFLNPISGTRYYFAITAFNTSGTESSRSNEVSAIFSVPDSTLPNVAITTPAGNVTVTNGTLAMAGTASDNVGVTQVTWVNSTGSGGTATGTTAWTASVSLQSGTNVITVTARDAAGNTRTASVTVTYNPDTTLPTIAITTPSGPLTVTTSPVAVSGTASDDIGVTQVSWSNSAGGSGTATGTTSWSANVTLQAGANIITFTARDAANNTRTAAVTVTFNPPDTTLPSLSISSPSGNVTVTTSPRNFSGTSSDNIGVTQVSWSSSRGASGTATGTTSWSASIPLVSGSNVITITARDAANNQRTASRTVTYNPPDTTAPAIAITSPSGPITVAVPTVALSGTASDAIGVTQVTWTNNRGGNGTATGTTSWSVPAVTLQTGANVITMTARDAAANTSTAAVTVTFTPPAPPPAVGLVSPSGNSVDTTPTYVWNATPSATRYQIWVNDANANGRIQTIYTPTQAGCSGGTGTCSVTPTVSVAGTVQWWIIAGNAGGDGPWSNPLTFVIGAADTTAPNVSISSPANNTTVTASSIAVSGSASDNVGVTQVTWTNDRGGSGTASGTTSWSIASVALQSGANVITVTARDAANNTRQASVTVNQSSATPPAAPVLVSPSGTSSANPPSFTWNAVSNASRYQIWVNDASANGVIQTIYTAAQAGCSGGTGNCSVSPGVAVSGSVQWWVIASNAAGDGPWSNPLTFTVGQSDTIAPNLAITSPSGNVTVTSPTLGLAGTANDNVGVTQVTWTNSRGGSGTASGTNSWSASVALQSGTNTITVTARDAANNSRSASVTVTYNAADTVLPSIAITSPAGPMTVTTSTVWLQGTASDNVGVTQVTWSSDRGFSGTATGTTSWSIPSVSVLSGANVITVTARDAANNARSASVTFTYNAADTTAPSVAITSPAGSVSVSTSPLSIAGTSSDNVGVTQVTWMNGATGSSGTASGTSSWSASVALQAGANLITVIARDAANNQDTATVTITYTPPSGLTAPVLVSPSGGISTQTPTYTWNAVAGAQSYALWVNDAGMNGRVDAIFSSAQAGCGSGTGVCSATPAVALAFGGGQFWVLAKAGSTESAWSAPMSFNVGGTTDVTPPNVAITSPASAISVTSPSISLAGTASDNVGVTSVTWTNNMGGSGSASGTTSWSIANVALQAGANVIMVTARDAANNTRQASVTVTYTPPAGLGTPVLVSPNSTASQVPTYRWNAVAGATTYEIWVNDSAMNGRVDVIVTAAQAGCGSGTGVCSSTPSIALSAGNAQWWVLARSGSVESAWSAPLSFWVP
jgi:hypothetical protein